MRRGTLDIIEFDPRRMTPAAASPPPAPFETDTQLDLLSHLRHRHRAAISVAAGLSVLVLHALVLLPAFWGRSSRPDPRRFGTPSIIHAVLIDDRSTNAITPPALSSPSLLPVSVNVPELPNRKDTNSGLAALYGRYLGQIHARISRAWLRPRTTIGASHFHCRVEIWQQRDGTVQTVTLQDCNGSIRWQQSLVKAIEHASPLPAPPDPAVFAYRVVLRFQAVAFEPGQPADGYEPARPTPTAANEASAALAQIRSLRALGLHAPSGIELSISGSAVQVEQVTTRAQSRTSRIH